MFDILILAYVFFVVMATCNAIGRYISGRIVARRQINERLAAI